MLLYGGCQLWDLDDPRVEELSVAWRVCCRRLLALHPRTRSHLLPHIMNCLLVRHIIEKRMLCFFIRGLKYPERQISRCLEIDQNWHIEILKELLSIDRYVKVRWIAVPALKTSQTCFAVSTRSPYKIISMIRKEVLFWGGIHEACR